MKLHLPSGLRRALLACLAAVALPTALPSTLASASGIAAVSFLASQSAAAEQQTADEYALAALLSEEEDEYAIMALASGDNPAADIQWTQVDINESPKASNYASYDATQNTKYVFGTGVQAVENGFYDFTSSSGTPNVYFTGTNKDTWLGLNLKGDFSAVYMDATSTRFNIGELSAATKDIYVYGGAQFWVNKNELTDLTANFHLGSGDGNYWSNVFDASPLAIEKNVSTTGYLELLGETQIIVSGGSTLSFGGAAKASGQTLHLLGYNNQGGTLELKQGGTFGSITTDIAPGSNGQYGSTTCSLLVSGGTLELENGGKLECGLEFSGESTGFTLGGELTTSGAVTGTIHTLTLNEGSSWNIGVNTLTATDVTITGASTLKLTDDAHLAFSSLSGNGSLFIDLSGITGDLNGYQLFTGSISSWYDAWSDKITLSSDIYTLGRDGTLTIQTRSALTWTGSENTVTLGDAVSGEGWEQGGGAVTDKSAVILQGTAPGEITVTVAGGDDSTVAMRSLTIGGGGSPSTSTYTFTAGSAQTLSVSNSLTVNADTTFGDRIALNTAAGSTITLGANLSFNAASWNVGSLSGEHQLTFIASDPGSTKEIVLRSNAALGFLNPYAAYTSPSTSKVFFGEGIGLVWDNSTTQWWTTTLTLSLDADDFQGRYVKLRRGSLAVGGNLDEYGSPLSWESAEGVEIIGEEGSLNLTVTGEYGMFSGGYYGGSIIHGGITMLGESLTLSYSMKLEGKLETATTTTVTFALAGDAWYSLGYPYSWHLMQGGSIGKMVVTGPYEIYLDDTFTIHGGITDKGMDDANRYAISFQRFGSGGKDDVQVVDIVDGGETVESRSGLLLGARMTFVKQGTGTQTFGGGGGTYAQTTNIAGKLDVQEGTLQLNGGGSISGELSGAGTLQVGAGGTLSITGGGKMSGTLEMSGGNLTVGTKTLSVGTLRLTKAGALTVQGEMVIGKVEGTAALTTLTLSDASKLTVNGGVLKADNIVFSPGSEGATLHLQVGATGGAQLSFSNTWNGKLTIQLEGWSKLADKVYQLFAEDGRYSSFWGKIQSDILRYFTFVDEDGQEIEHLTLDKDGYLFFGDLQEWNGNGNTLQWGSDNVWKLGKETNKGYDSSLSVLFDGTNTPVTVTLSANITTDGDMTVQRGVGVGEKEQVYTFAMGNHNLTVGQQLTVKEGISAEFTGTGNLTVSGGTDVSGTLIVGTSGTKNLGNVQLQEGSSLVVKNNGNWTSTTVSGTGALVYDGVESASLGDSLNALLGDGFTGQVELRGGAALTQGSDMTQLKNSSKLVIGADKGDVSSLTFNAGGSTDHEIELRSKGEIVVSGSNKLNLGKLNAKDGKLTLSGALDVNFGENSSFSSLVVNSGGDLTTELASGTLQFGDITLNSDLNLHLGILSDLTLGARSITGNHKMNVSLDEHFLQLVADGTGKYKLFEGASWTESVVQFVEVEGYTIKLTQDGNISVTSNAPGTRDEFTGFVYHESSASDVPLKQNTVITVSSGQETSLTFDGKSLPLLNLKVVNGTETELTLDGSTSFTGLNSVYFTGKSDFIENGNFKGGGPKTVYIKDGQLYFSGWVGGWDVLDLQSDFVIGASTVGRNFGGYAALALSEKVTTTGSLTLAEDAAISFHLTNNPVMTFGGAVDGEGKTLSLFCPAAGDGSSGTGKLVLQGGGTLKKLESAGTSVGVELQGTHTLTLQEGGTIAGTLTGDGKAGLALNSGTLEVGAVEGSFGSLTLGRGVTMNVGGGSLVATTFNMEGDATLGIGNDVTLNFTNSQKAGKLTLDIGGLLAEFEGVKRTYDLFDQETFSAWYQQFTTLEGSVILSGEFGGYDVSFDEETGQAIWTIQGGYYEYKGSDGEQLVWDTTTEGSATHWEGDKQWEDGSKVLFSATDDDNEVIIGSNLETGVMQVSSGGYHFSSSAGGDYTLDVEKLLVEKNVTMEFDAGIHLSVGKLTASGASSTERSEVTFNEGVEVDNFSNNTNVDYKLGGDLVLHDWEGTDADSVHFSKVEGVTDPVSVRFDFSEMDLTWAGERPYTYTLSGYSFEDVGLYLNGGDKPLADRPDYTWPLARNIYLTFSNTSGSEAELNFPVIEVEGKAVLSFSGYQVTTDSLNLKMGWNDAGYPFANYEDLEISNHGSLTVKKAATGDGIINVLQSVLTLEQGGRLGGIMLGNSAELVLGDDLELCGFGGYSNRSFFFSIQGTSSISLREGASEAYILFGIRNGATSCTDLGHFLPDGVTGANVAEGIGFGIYSDTKQEYTVKNGGEFDYALKIKGAVFNLEKPAAEVQEYQFQKKVVVTDEGELNVSEDVKATFVQGLAVQGTLTLEEGANVGIGEGTVLRADQLTLAARTWLTVGKDGKLDFLNVGFAEGVESGTLTIDITGIVEETHLENGETYQLFESAVNFQGWYDEFVGDGGTILFMNDGAPNMYQLSGELDGTIMQMESFEFADGNLTWGTDQKDSGWKDGKDWTEGTNGSVLFTATGGTHTVTLTSDVKAENLIVEGGGATYNVLGRKAYTLTLGYFAAQDEVTMNFQKSATLVVNGNFTSRGSASKYTFAERLTVGGTLSLSGTETDPVEMTLEKGADIGAFKAGGKVKFTLGGDLNVSGDFTSENLASDYTFAEKLTVGGKLSLSGTGNGVDEVAKMTLKKGGSVGTFDALDKAQFTLGDDLVIEEFQGGDNVTLSTSFKKDEGTEGDVYVDIHSSVTLTAGETLAAGATKPFDDVGLKASEEAVVRFATNSTWNFGEGKLYAGAYSRIVLKGGEVTAGGAVIDNPIGDWSTRDKYYERFGLCVNDGAKLTLTDEVSGEGRMVINSGEVHLNKGGKLGGVSVSWNTSTLYLGDDLELTGEIVCKGTNPGAELAVKREEGVDDMVYVLFNTGESGTSHGTLADYGKKMGDGKVTIDKSEVGVGKSGKVTHIIEGGTNNTLDWELKVKEGTLSFAARPGAKEEYNYTLGRKVHVFEGATLELQNNASVKISDTLLIENEPELTEQATFSLGRDTLLYVMDVEVSKDASATLEVLDNSALLDAANIKMLGGATLELQKNAHVFVHHDFSLDDTATLSLSRKASFEAEAYKGGTSGGTVSLALTSEQKVSEGQDGQGMLFFEGFEGRMTLQLNAYELEDGMTYQIFGQNRGEDFLSKLSGNVKLDITNDLDDDLGFDVKLNEKGQIVVTKKASDDDLTWNSRGEKFVWKLDGEEVWDKKGSAAAYQNDKNVIFDGSGDHLTVNVTVVGELAPLDMTVKGDKGITYVFTPQSAITDTLTVQRDLILEEGASVTFNGDMAVTVGRNLYTRDRSTITLGNEPLVIEGNWHLKGSTGNDRIILQHAQGAEGSVYIQFSDISADTYLTVDDGDPEHLIEDVLYCNSGTQNDQIEFNGVGIRKTGGQDLKLYCYQGGGVILGRDGGHLTLISPYDSKVIQTVVHGDVSVGSGATLTFREFAQITGTVRSEEGSTIELSAMGQSFPADSASKRGMQYRFDQGGDMKGILSWEGTSSLYLGDHLTIGGLVGERVYKGGTLPVDRLFSTEKEINFTIDLKEENPVMKECPEFQENVNLVVQSDNPDYRQTFWNGFVAHGDVTLRSGRLRLGIENDEEYKYKADHDEAVTPAPTIDGNLIIRGGVFEEYSSGFTVNNRVFVGTKGGSQEAVFEYRVDRVPQLTIPALTMYDNGVLRPRNGAAGAKTTITELTIDTSAGAKASLDETVFDRNSDRVLTLQIDKLDGNGEFDFGDMGVYEALDDNGANVLGGKIAATISLIDDFNGRLSGETTDNNRLQVKKLNVEKANNPAVTVDLALSTEISGEISGVETGTLKFSQPGCTYIVSGGGNMPGTLELGGGTDTTVTNVDLSVGTLTAGEKSVLRVDGCVLKADKATVDSGVKLYVKMNGAKLDFGDITLAPREKLKIELTDYNGGVTYQLFERETFGAVWEKLVGDGNWYDVFDITGPTWTEEGVREIIRLDEYGVVHFRAADALIWQGGKDGVWRDDNYSTNGDPLWWDQNLKPRDKTVHFKRMEDGREPLDGQVSIGSPDDPQGYVTPSEVIIDSGEFTFTQSKGTTGGLNIAPGTDKGLTINPDATLHLNLKNTSIPTVNLQERGTLGIGNKEALPEGTKLQFNGGTLLYDVNGGAQDVSSLVDPEGSGDHVKVQVEETVVEGVAWGSTNAGPNKGVSFALDSGLDKSGAGDFTLAWQDDGTTEHGGKFTVDEGKLILDVSANGDAKLTGADDDGSRIVAEVAEGAQLELKADKGRLDVQGNVTGAGMLNVSTGEVVLRGANDVADITLSNGSITNIVGDDALGDENTTLNLNGGTIASGAPTKVQAGTVNVGAADTVEAADTKLYGNITFTGHIHGEEFIGDPQEGVRRTLTVTQGYHVEMSGDISDYTGGFATEADSSWTLSGTALEGQDGIVTNAAIGDGTVYFATPADDDPTLYSGKVEGKVTLKSGEGGLVIISTHEDNSSDAILDASEGTITLGDNLHEQAVWNGNQVVDGKIVLSDVTLAPGGLINIGRNVDVSVYTAKYEGKGTHAGVVDMNGMKGRNPQGTSLSSITINEDGRLLNIDGSFKVDRQRTAELHFSSENVGMTKKSSDDPSSEEKNPLITGTGKDKFTFDAMSEGMTMYLETDAVSALIGCLARNGTVVGEDGVIESEGQPVYLYLMEEGTLKMNPVDVFGSDGKIDEKKFVQFFLGDDAALLATMDITKITASEDGYLEFQGSVVDVFVTPETEPKDGHYVLKDADMLDSVKATVLAHKYDELHLALDGATQDTTVHNLLGITGSELYLENTRDPGTEMESGDPNRLEVTFENNKVETKLRDEDKFPGDIDGTTVYGQNTNYNGSLFAGENVDVRKTGKGTLSVGGTYKVDQGTTTIDQGALRLRGEENTLRNLEFAYTDPQDTAHNETNRGLLLEGGKTTITGEITDDKNTADGNDIVLSKGAELTLKGNNTLNSTGIIGDEENGSGKLVLDGDKTGQGGQLTLNGEGAKIDENGNITGAQLSGVDVQLGNGGALTLGENAGMDVGEVVLNEGGTLDVGAGKANHVDSLQSAKTGKGTLKSSDGGELHVGGGSFSGTLDSSEPDSAAGKLVVDDGAEFTFDHVTTTTNDPAKGWDVQVGKGSNLTVDVTGDDKKGKETYFGDVSVGDGNLTLKGTNPKDLQHVHGGNLTWDEGGRIVLSSDGEAVDDLFTLHFNVEKDKLDSGEFEDHLDLKGAAFFTKDLTDVDPDGEGGVALHFKTAQDNKFERVLPNMEKNAHAGATMVWEDLKDRDAMEGFFEQLMDQDSDRVKMLNGLVAMYESGATSEMEKAFAAIAGSSVSVLGPAFVQDLHRQLGAIRNRTTTMAGEVSYETYDKLPMWHAWLNAEGNYHKMDSDGFAPGYTLNNWGGTVGADVDVSPATTVGFALTAMYGDLKPDAADAATGDLDTTYLSAFARTTKGAWIHTFVLSVGMADVSLNRTVNAGGVNYRTQGSTDGYAVGALYEVGYTKLMNRRGTMAFQPVFNVEIRHAAIKGYTETGSDAGLKVDDIEQDVVTFGFGARLQSIVGENMYNRTSVLEGRLLVKADVGDNTGVAKNSLIGAAAVGEVESAEVGALGIEAGIGLTIPLGASAGSVFMDASAEVRSGWTSFNATVGYRINF